MKPSGVIGIVLLGIVVILGLTWAGQGNDFFMFKVFAPKYEQVRRETFEQTKSYNQGMIQELQNMRFDYVKTDNQQQRDALASIMLHRAADYPEDKMPNDLRSFIADLKRERTQAR